MKSALLTCILFAPSVAHSAIIYHVIPENEQIFLSGQRAFDFDGNGAVDLTFSGGSPDFQLLTVTAGPIGFILLERSIGINAAVLGEGAIVSSAGRILPRGQTRLPLFLNFSTMATAPCSVAHGEGKAAIWDLVFTTYD